MLTHVRKEARAYLQDWGYASPKPESFVVGNIHLSVSKGLDGIQESRKTKDQRLLAPFTPRQIKLRH